MKKILIFGTGSGAQNYLEGLDRTHYELIGFLDNDPKKQKGLFLDKPVYAPDVLNTVLHYDEIHIASMWAIVIKEQLIKSYAIPEQKIISFSKDFLKNTGVFDSDQIQTLMKRFIDEICAFFNTKTSVPLYLDGGALLGILRAQELIRWDSDIDFLIQDKHVTAFETAIEDYIKNTFLHEFYDLTLNKNELRFDLLLTPKSHFEEQQSIPIAFNIAYFKDDHAWINQGLFFIPKPCFDAVSWIDLHPGKASTLNNPEAYLKLMYGNDWKTPKKDFDISEYGNIVTKK